MYKTLFSLLLISLSFGAFALSLKDISASDFDQLNNDLDDKKMEEIYKETASGSKTFSKRPQGQLRPFNSLGYTPDDHDIRTSEGDLIEAR